MAVALYKTRGGTVPASGEIAVLAELVRTHGRATLIVPSLAERKLCRRALANAGCGLAVEVTTPTAWIASLWELMGDGRALVGTKARKLLAAQVLADASEGASRSSGVGDASVVAFEDEDMAPHAERGRAGAAAHSAPTPHAVREELRETRGMVEMLARAARDLLPALQDKAPGAQLSAAERRVVELVAAYGERLDAAGYLEPSAAATLLATGFLAEGVPACARAVAVRGIAEYPRHLSCLLTAVAGEGEVAILAEPEADALASELRTVLLEEGVTVRSCALPACDDAASEEGPHASVPLVPRIAEVAGPTARAAAYTQLIDELAHEAVSNVAAGGQDVVAQTDSPESGAPTTIAVAVPHPLTALRDLAPRLAARGIAVAGEESLAFERTRAGEAFFMLADVVERLETEEPSAWWPAPELPDWMRSPFSGLGPAAARAAHTLDSHLRKTRKLTRDTLWAELDRLQSRERQRAHDRAAAAEAEGLPATEPCPIVVRDVLDAIRRGAYARALALMREAAAGAPAGAFGPAGTAAQQAELAALDAALSLFEEARAWDVGEERAFTVLPALRVRAAYTVAPQAVSDRPVQVTLTTIDTLAAAAPMSYDAVLLANADAASYPLSVRATVADLLAEKLGAAPYAMAPAPRQRRAFRCALGTARTSAALAYVAHDAHGEELYPALALTELRAREAALPARTPAAHAEPLPTEGALFANLDPAGGRGACVDQAPRPAEHALAPELNPFLFLPTRVVGGEPRPRTLSASQIESYLACPYRWLVTNRVSTRRLDAGFGPIEMGNFVHDVMQRFHERLIEAGLARVTPANLDACLAELEIAFDETRDDHARGKHTHGRYSKATGGKPQTIKGPLVATDELERNQIEAMRPKLREVVRHESDMLSIFSPALLEYAFDKEGVSYAGRPLGGRIDRIDTAPRGRVQASALWSSTTKTAPRSGSLPAPTPTMALDEDEQLSPAWLPGREADRAPKVQTLIYATAYARLTGGSPQGAVYFGTRGPVVKGAVAAALVESEPPAFPRDKVSGYPGVKPARGRERRQARWRARVWRAFGAGRASDCRRARRARGRPCGTGTGSRFLRALPAHDVREEALRCRSWRKSRSASSARSRARSSSRREPARARPSRSPSGCSTRSVPGSKPRDEWADPAVPEPFLDGIDQVLAITFTEKAAAELKERIRAGLIAEGMETEAERADGAWISTIHGMCARIIRAHALDLGVDPGFSVAEYADDLKRRAAEHVLRRVSAEDAQGSGCL